MCRGLGIFLTQRESVVETEQMSSVATGQMPAVETGQMSAAGTGHMFALEVLRSSLEASKELLADCQTAGAVGGGPPSPPKHCF